MARESWQLGTLLSPARMAPYLTTCAGSWSDALSLYDWNTRVSAAFFESIHYLEIGLRNALDQTAVERLGGGWLSPTSPLLTSRSQQAVSIAQGHAGGPRAPHGKVVAELPFGFWWSLLADEYNRRLWQPALRFAFDGPVRRRTLHHELDEIRRLRNRIAHHEPIHNRDLSSDFQRLLGLSERLAPALGEHIAHTSRVADLLAARPQARAANTTPSG
jgi:hypothetical protein